MVRGWSWGLEQVVQATPADDLSRSRLVDRWDAPPSGGAAPASLTLAGDALHPMTPNLGQGGCTALEDALVLARSLQQQGVPFLATQLQRGGAGGGSRDGSLEAAAAAGVRAAVGAYERERSARCLPLTVRSHAMGALLQVRRGVRSWSAFCWKLPALFGHTAVPPLTCLTSPTPARPARRRRCRRWPLCATWWWRRPSTPPTFWTTPPTTAGGCWTPTRPSLAQRSPGAAGSAGKEGR